MSHRIFVQGVLVERDWNFTAKIFSIEFVEMFLL